MKDFLAIYVGTPASMAQWELLPESERQERQAAGIRAWHEWMERNKASIVTIGAPLSKTKRVSSQGISDIRNNMSGFTVVRAASQQDAAKLFESHPHFTIFPGDSVEVMECLPIPSM
jgi:ribosomal protein S17